MIPSWNFLSIYAVLGTCIGVEISCPIGSYHHRCHKLLGMGKSHISCTCDPETNTVVRCSLTETQIKFNELKSWILDLECLDERYSEMEDTALDGIDWRKVTDIRVISTNLTYVPFPPVVTVPKLRAFLVAYNDNMNYTSLREVKAGKQLHTIIYGFVPTETWPLFTVDHDAGPIDRIHLAGTNARHIPMFYFDSVLPHARSIYIGEQHLLAGLPTGLFDFPRERTEPYLDVVIKLEHIYHISFDAFDTALFKTFNRQPVDHKKWLTRNCTEMEYFDQCLACEMERTAELKPFVERQCTQQDDDTLDEYTELELPLTVDDHFHQRRSLLGRVGIIAGFVCVVLGAVGAVMLLVLGLDLLCEGLQGGCTATPPHKEYNRPRGRR